MLLQHVAAGSWPMVGCDFEFAVAVFDVIQ